MKSKLEATFTIVKEDEQIFSESGKGPKLTTTHFVVNYHGDIQGRGVVKELKYYHSDSKASIYGLERITGTVDVLHGSFVLEHRGIYENGYIKSKRTIIPGSGTGDLEGISGDMNVESGPAKEYPVTLNCVLE